MKNKKIFVITKPKRCSCGKIHRKLPCKPAGRKEISQLHEDEAILKVFPAAALGSMVWWNCSCGSTIAVEKTNVRRA